MSATTVFRLSVLYLAAFLLLGGAIGIAINWLLNRAVTSQIAQTLEAEAAALERTFANDGFSGLTQAITERSRGAGPGLYILESLTGTKIAGNLDRLPPTLLTRREGGLFRYVPHDRAAKDPRLAAGLLVVLRQRGRLLVARDIEDVRRLAERAQRLLLLALGTLTLFGLAFAYLISRAIMRRVDATTAASLAIMRGDLAQRLPVSASGDEFDRLSTSLNAMLARIEQLMVGLSEVSDNIAHDLKTPLNRLRNQCESALRDPRGGPAYREGLERTIEMADELIRTFNALLAIARLEANAVPEGMEPLDIAAIVADIAELYEPVAEEHGMSLALTPPPPALAPVRVKGNRQLIGQALTNLVENAIKYGRGSGQPPDGADITLAMALTGRSVEIVVADRGPGIGEADRERALRRFVRLEASRSAPGTGLGLSLVSAVTRLHGGTLRLEDNAPGLRIVLALPIAEGSEGPVAARP
ncbi:MAG: sensor histidine kinase [Hyphomicrobiaceae bacterium]